MIMDKLSQTDLTHIYTHPFSRVVCGVFFFSCPWFPLSFLGLLWVRSTIFHSASVGTVRTVEPNRYHLQRVSEMEGWERLVRP